MGTSVERMCYTTNRSLLGGRSMEVVVVLANGVEIEIREASHAVWSLAGRGRGLVLQVYDKGGEEKKQVGEFSAAQVAGWYLKARSAY